MPKKGNPLLPTLAIDAADISIRSYADGTPQDAILRFYSVMPDAALEMVRIHSSFANLRALVDLLTRMIDYYPQRPGEGPRG